jgi:hypothetical protein
MKYFPFFLSIFILSSCTSFSENNIKQTLVSPDGKYIAISFIRSTGATTSFSPQVSILKAGEKLMNKPGNIFIGDHSEYINISWVDNVTLLVNHLCTKDNIFKEINVYNGITIKYNSW